MPTKIYGQAKDAAERAVEGVLERLAREGARIDDARYTRVLAGISNFNWLVDYEGTRKFLKICNGDASAPEKRLAREASYFAGVLGIGPRQIQLIEDLGAEIYEFLDGFDQCTVELFLLKPNIRSRVLAAVRTAHDGPALRVTRTGFDQLHERLAHIGTKQVHLPGDIDQLLQQCFAAESTITSSGMEIVPSHNDLYFANIMTNPQGDIRIIDWEYATNNDRAWDLANISMSTGSDIDPIDIAREYDVPDPEILAARIVLMRVVLLISWGLWASTQALESGVDYDYRQHAFLLFQSARFRISSPQWEDALRILGERG